MSQQVIPSILGDRVSIVLGDRIFDPVTGTKGIAVGFHFRLAAPPRVEVRRDGDAEACTQNYWFAPHQLKLALPAADAAKAGE